MGFGMGCIGLSLIYLLAILTYRKKINSSFVVVEIAVQFLKSHLSLFLG